MSKSLKTIVLLATIALAGILIKNIFFENDKEKIDSKIYHDKLKPINFTPKEFPELIQDNNDIAIKFARIWNLTDIYNKTSESCLGTFVDQHPNNIVLKQNLTSLYGIEIGTHSWYKLTGAYEKYAIGVCYSYSGYEIEDIYAKSLREKLTEKELTEIYKFYSTEVGKKYVDASNNANNNIEMFIAKKQRYVVNKEAEVYNKLIEELQKESK